MKYFKLFILLAVIWFVDFLIFSYLSDFGVSYIKLIENQITVKILLVTYFSFILVSIWLFYVICANYFYKTILKI